MRTLRLLLILLSTVLVVTPAVLSLPATVGPAAADAGEARPGVPRGEAALITAGGAHTCVIVTAGAGPGGDVRCWGDNAYGQLGLGTTDDRGDQPGEMASTPSIDLGAKAVAVSAGQYHTCALMAGGSVKCWGRNDVGQLGLGDTSNRGDNAGEMGANLPSVSLGSGRTAVAVAAGGSFSCALLDNAAVKCWGANASGQLGVGDTTSRGDGANEMGNNLPAIQFGDGVAALSIAAGQSHACAIVTEFTIRSIRCWGENGEGQLGLGNTFDRGDGPSEVASAAPAVPNASNVTALALGRAHTCAIIDQRVACWGANNSGQLGRGTIGQNRGDAPGEMADADSQDMASPTVLRGVTALADSTCVQMHSHVACWGESGRGQAGINFIGDIGGPGFSLVTLSTVAIPGDPSTVAVAGGDNHACAVLASRDVICWGGNEAGQLGQGNGLDVGTVARTMANAAVVAMSVGYHVSAVDVDGHACALLDGGAVKCWGSPGLSGNALGSGSGSETVGDDAGEIAAHPTVDLGPGRSASQVEVGYGFTCVLLTTGEVACWGRNNNGQLGAGNLLPTGGSGTMGSNLPTVNLGTGRTALSISVGLNHTCALLDNHAVKCWGGNFSGELGVGATGNRGDHAGEMGDNLPAVNLGTGRTALEVSAGPSHSCALLDDHTVKCWGSPFATGLGGLFTGHSPSSMGDNLPTVDLGTGRTATEVVADETSCARLDNGTVKCWGANAYGSAGVGSTAMIGDGPGEMGDNLPVAAIGTGRTAAAVRVGQAVSCALLDNATVRCWGRNDSGQLGLDDTAHRGDVAGEMGDNLPIVKLPVTVVPTSISVGSVQTCAVSTAQQLYCWGFFSLLGRGFAAGNLGDAAGEMAAIGPMELGGLPYKVLTATPTVGTPDAPTLTAATSAGQSAVLIWSGPFGQQNNGSPISGYRIETATSAAGPWSINGADTGPAAFTAAAVGLPTNTTVYLRVRAINGAGVGAPSNVRSVQTTVAYVPLTPFRLVDTRPTGMTGDGQQAAGGALAAGQTFTVNVANRGGVLANATAVALNVTAVNPTGTGFLTVYPCDVARPNASTLNYVVGRNTPNTTISEMSATGTVCVFSSNATHLLVDVGGMYPAGSPYLPLTPARVVDTRPTGVTVDGLYAASGMLAAGEAKAHDLIGRGGLPPDQEPGDTAMSLPGAVVVNITSVGAATGGFVTVWGCQSDVAPARPNSSSLNFPGGRNIANLAILNWTTAGRICVYTSQATHVIVDVVGFIPATSGLISHGPARFADTRPSGTTVDGQHAATGAITAGQTRTIEIVGRDGLPVTAGAAVLNVTAVSPSGSGFLTVYPCDVARPTASNLNVASQTVANLAIAKLSASGTVCVYSSVTTHLIVDVFGTEQK